jgi:putative hydrolase of the HAD superfamily
VIGAVLFDLDDTLYPQADFLRGAWGAVAEAATAHGVGRSGLLRALRSVGAEGSDRGGIIDRALVMVGAGHVPVAPLVDAFKAHRPHRLTAYPGAAEAVARVRALVPVGLVSDGDPGGQRGKLTALGLTGAFDAVGWSDELGRICRKPSVRPFLHAANQLDVRPDDVVVIGDRPDKDVLGAHRAGMRAVRVRTGEYRDAPDIEAPWREAADVVEAVDLVCSAEEANVG